MTKSKLITTSLIVFSSIVSIAQEKKPFISSFYLQTSPLNGYQVIGDKPFVDYGKFQSGRDAFVVNNDLDYLRKQTHFDVQQLGWQVGLMYNLTENEEKRFTHHIGLMYFGNGQFQASNSVSTTDSQTIDSVEVQSSGTKLPVNMVTSTSETETYTAKSNLIGINYMMSFHLNKRWLINTNVSASYYLVQRATGYITRTTTYSFEPNVYPENVSYGIDQFGQKLGIQLGRIGATLSPMVMLNSENKRRDGNDFRCRYYFGFQIGFGLIAGKVNTANYYYTDFTFGANLLVQPFKLKGSIRGYFNRFNVFD